MVLFHGNVVCFNATINFLVDMRDVGKVVALEIELKEILEEKGNLKSS